MEHLSRFTYLDLVAFFEPTPPCARWPPTAPPCRALQALWFSFPLVWTLAQCRLTGTVGQEEWLLCLGDFFGGWCGALFLPCGCSLECASTSCLRGTWEGGCNKA